MCIANMVETIVNHWSGDDWNDTEAAAARDFPQAMIWEVGYALDLAKDLRVEEGAIVSVELIDEPIEKDLIFPPVTVRILTIKRRARAGHAT